MSNAIGVAFVIVAVIALPVSPLASVLLLALAAVNFGPGNQLEDTAEAAEAAGAPPSAWGCGADLVGLALLIMLALFAMAGLGMLGGV